MKLATPIPSRFASFLPRLRRETDLRGRRRASLRPMTQLALVMLLAGSVPFAQTTYIVDVNEGPGAAFSSLRTAMETVAEGSVLLVRSGYYPETILTVGKSLTIQAQRGATVEVDKFDVRGLAASQVFAVRGLSVKFLYIGTGDPNAGSVVFEDMDIMKIPLYSGSCTSWKANVRVEDSANVVFSNCRFFPTFRGPCQTTPTSRPYALRMINSSVHLYDSQLLGEVGRPGFPGASTVFLEGGELVVFGTTIIGGDASFLPGGEGGGGGIFVEGGSPSLIVVDSTIQGGIGAIGGGGLVSPAIYHPGRATITYRTEQARSHSGPSPVRVGEAHDLVFEGDPGDIVTLFFSGFPGGPIVAPMGAGFQLLASPTFSIPMGVIPASGSLIQRFVFPQEIPLGTALPIFHQAVYQNPTTGETVTDGLRQVNVLPAIRPSSKPGRKTKRVP